LPESTSKEENQIMAMQARAMITKAALTAALGLGVAIPAALAQDQTTTNTNVNNNFMATLHLGTCEQADAQPIADLGMLAPYGQWNVAGQPGTGVNDGTMNQDGTVQDGTVQDGTVQDGTVVQDPTMNDQAMMNQNYRGTQVQGQPVLTANLTLDMPFDDVLDNQRMHLLAIHEGQISPEAMIACGSIGGFEQDGRVVVPLRSVNDSGHAGVAILDDDDAGFLGLGEAQTQMTVYLIPDATGQGTGMQQGDAAGDAQQGDAAGDAQQDDAAGDNQQAGEGTDGTPEANQ
jgi:hypothetical protein